MVVRKKPSDTLIDWKKKFIDDEKVEKVEMLDGSADEDYDRFVKVKTDADFKEFLIGFMDGCEENAFYGIYIMFEYFSNLKALFTEEEIWTYLEYASEYYPEESFDFLPKKMRKSLQAYYLIPMGSTKAKIHLASIIDKNSIKYDIPLFETENGLNVKTINIKGKKYLQRNEGVDKLLIDLISQVGKKPSMGILAFIYTKTGQLNVLHATISSQGANMNEKNLARWGYRSARVFGMLSEAFFRGAKEYKKWIPMLFDKGSMLKEQVFFWAELVDAKELKELKTKITINGLRMLYPNNVRMLVDQIGDMLQGKIAHSMKNKVTSAKLFDFKAELVPRAKAIVVDQPDGKFVDVMIDYGDKTYCYAVAEIIDGEWDFIYYQSRFELPVKNYDVLIEELGVGKSYWNKLPEGSSIDLVIENLYNWLLAGSRPPYNVEIIQEKKYSGSRIEKHMNAMAKWN